MLMSVFCLLTFTTTLFADEAATSSPPVVESVTLRGTHLKVDFATQVGHPYDAALAQQDLHRLWNTGRFDDIRVERETSIIPQTRWLADLQPGDRVIGPALKRLAPQLPADVAIVAVHIQRPRNQPAGV